MARFGEVLTAMVTPFADDGSFDPAGAADLARWLVDQGNDGLIVAGTTGEGSVLSDDEKLDLWRAVAEAVTVPVVAATGSNDTAHTVALTRQAKGVGASGVLVVTPYYNRPSATGMEAHFRAVAGATELPVMLYDIPFRTGRKIPHDVLVRLGREVTNIVAVKDAAGDVAASATLVADAGGHLELYSGSDDLTLALLAVGAVGTVGVATHWAAAEHQELFTAFAKGDVVGAREVNTRLLPSFRWESTDAAPNPVPAKAMMRTLGLAVGECRLPMGSAPAGLEDEARAIYAGLGRSGS